MRHLASSASSRKTFVASPNQSNTPTPTTSSPREPRIREVEQCTRKRIVWMCMCATRVRKGSTFYSAFSSTAQMHFHVSSIEGECVALPLHRCCSSFRGGVTAAGSFYAKTLDTRPPLPLLPILPSFMGLVLFCSLVSSRVLKTSLGPTSRASAAKTDYPHRKLVRVRTAVVCAIVLRLQ